MKQYPFISTGKVVYDPPRPTKLARGKDYWAVIQVDREITRYFRWWVDKEIMNPLGFDEKKHAQKHGFEKLDAPSFDAHISVIRGFKDARHNMGEVKRLWKKYQGDKVEFRWNLNVRFSGDTTGGDRADHYWFIDVQCPIVDKIRKEMGLRTGFKPHLTIGRTWD